MKELTYEDWQKDPTPRMMWVWDDDVRLKMKKKVVYILKDKYTRNVVMAIHDDKSYFTLYRSCAEIEEPTKSQKQEVKTTKG